MDDHVTSLPPYSEIARKETLEIRQAERDSRPGKHIIRVRTGRLEAMAGQVVIVPRVGAPPIAVSNLALSSSFYVGDEATVIEFVITRADGYQNEVWVDWEITGASVSPSTGTARFLRGEGVKTILVTAASVTITEVGLLRLTNPRNITDSDPELEPQMLAPSTASFTITNVIPASITIGLAASSYSGNENTIINFVVNRTGEVSTDSVRASWTVTGASVIPASGTVTFAVGETQQVIAVAAQEVISTQVGTLTLSNPVNLSGGVAPVLGAIVTASVTVINTTIVTGAKRWNPGHYVNPNGDPFDNTTEAQFLAVMLNTLQTKANDIPEFKGVMFPVPWGWIEPTLGTFSWSFIDTMLNAAVAQGQRILIMPHYKSFLWPNNVPNSKPATVESPADLLPRVFQHNQGWLAPVWDADVMERYILMLEAIANRYDGNDGFEGILTPEAVLSFGGLPNGPPPSYNIDVFADLLVDMYTRMEAAFLRINCFPQINSLSNHVTQLFEAAYALRIGIGSPDARETPGWWFFEGGDTANDGTGEQAPRDYRTQLARGTTISFSVYSKGGPTGNGRDAPGVIDFMQLQQVTHAFWHSSDVDATNTFNAAKLAIQADPALNTACPTRYVACGAEPPPPTSDRITGITLNFNTLKNIAPGNSVSAPESDNWPITWAWDGHQYTSFGDGRGFGNLTGNTLTRGSFGFSRIEGTQAGYSAFDVFKSGEAMPTSEQGKCYGMLGANGKLYAAVDYFLVGGNGSREDRYHGVSIIKSENGGVSWSQTIRWDSGDWGGNQLTGFYSLAFVQFGQDHAKPVAATSVAATDAYVYALICEHDDDVYNVQKPGGISLVRCLESNLDAPTKSNWSYFTGTPTNPSWSTNLTNRANIFQDATDGNDSSSMFYNEPLGRYILTTLQTDRTAIGGAKIGIYDAPEPWGPWSTVLKTNATTLGLMDGDNAIFWGFSPKWLSGDGLNFVMVGTLLGRDEWGTVEGSFTLSPATGVVFPEEHFPQVSVDPGAASLSLPSGKAMLVIGMSNTNQYTAELIPLAGASKTTIVNGAQGGAAAAQWAISGNSAWTVAATELSNAGFSASDVSVVMVCVVDRVNGRDYATYVADLEVQYNSIITNIRSKYPGAIITMNGLHNEFWATSHPEPHAWGSNSVCQLIIDQNPDVYWGPYIWSPEPNGRSGDGFNITEADHEINGNVHLTQAGSLKVAQSIMTWFSTDAIGRSIFS